MPHHPNDPDFGKKIPVSDIGWVAADRPGRWWAFSSNPDVKGPDQNFPDSEAAIKALKAAAPDTAEKTPETT